MPTIGSGIQIPKGTDASKVKIRLTRVAAAKFVFNFANNSNTNSAETSPSTTSLVDAIDIKDLMSALMANTAITISGSSISPTFAFDSTVIPAGIKLEIQSAKDSKYYDVAGAANGAIFAKNLFNSNTGDFDSTSIGYKISLLDPDAVMFDSSTNDPLSSESAIGTVSLDTTALTKYVATSSFALSDFVFTGNTFDTFDITEPNIDPNLSLEYTLLDSTGAQLASGDKAAIKTYVGAHNL